MQKVLNDKAVNLLKLACKMAKEGKKKFTDFEESLVIRTNEDGFTIKTKACKMQVLKKPAIHYDFYIIEPYSVIIYGIKTKKTLFKGVWENKVLTVRKVQLIKH